MAYGPQRRAAGYAHGAVSIGSCPSYHEASRRAMRIDDLLGLSSGLACSLWTCAVCWLDLAVVSKARLLNSCSTFRLQCRNHLTHSVSSNVPPHALFCNFQLPRAIARVGIQLLDCKTAKALCLDSLPQTYAGAGFANFHQLSLNSNA